MLALMTTEVINSAPRMNPKVNTFFVIWKALLARSMFPPLVLTERINSSNASWHWALHAAIASSGVLNIILVMCHCFFL